MIDLSRDLRPVPKPTRTAKEGTRRRNSTLKSRTRLKSNYIAVPEAVKKEALKKSAFCFAGLCPVCGGLPVTVNDDPHHFPKRSQGGKDIPEHVWMCKRICHSYIHDHPLEEKAMFKKIEATGFPVDWNGEFYRR